MSGPPQNDLLGSYTRKQSSTSRASAKVRSSGPDRTFCIVGEWKDMDSLATARPQMIGLLDKMRDLLEDLGDELGVTDAVSGTVVADIGT